ncbi:hypothetical protein U1Q18_051250 [Sarracenia purpurea var. burkii]
MARGPSFYFGGRIVLKLNKKRYKVEEKKHREMEQVRSLIQRVCLPLRYLPGGVPPPAVGISSFSYTNVPLYTDNSINDFSNYKSTVCLGVSPSLSLTRISSLFTRLLPGSPYQRTNASHHTSGIAI